jgi:hypothetical protein
LSLILRGVFSAAEDVKSSSTVRRSYCDVEENPVIDINMGEDEEGQVESQSPLHYTLFDMNGNTMHLRSIKPMRRTGRRLTGHRSYIASSGYVAARLWMRRKRAKILPDDDDWSSSFAYPCTPSLNFAADV